MKKLIIAITAITVLYSSAFASSYEREWKNRDAEYGITLEEAVKIAQKEIPGRVIEAELEKGIYEIKIRTENGEKVKVKIDPKDGSIIRKGKLIKEFKNGFSKSKSK